MWYEISQYDIPNRQLLATNRKPGADRWTEIGEVKITHTIFGKAKVSVTREQDKKRRKWLLAVVVFTVTALVAAVWQGWISLHPGKLFQSETAPLPSSEGEGAKAPYFHPDYLGPYAIPPSLENKPLTLPQNIATNPAASHVTAPPLLLKASEPIAAKPVVPQPLPASKPQTSSSQTSIPQAATLATGNNSAQNQTNLQQPPKPSTPIQPAAPATHPAIPPAIRIPEAVVPPVKPLIEENTPNQAPAGDDNQLAEPAKQQP